MYQNKIDNLEYQVRQSQMKWSNYISDYQNRNNMNKNKIKLMLK